MNVSPAHWHLLVNHFPIILVMTGALFLTIGLLMKKDAIKSTALLMIILAAVTAMIANATGEPAEEQIEGIAGVSHNAIEVHEHAAQTGLVITLITGAIALISAFVFAKNKKTGNTFVIITLIAALVSSGYMGYVGLTGGEIRHSEIRGDFGRNATTGQTEATTPQNGAQEREEDND